MYAHSHWATPRGASPRVVTPRTRQNGDCMRANVQLSAIIIGGDTQQHRDNIW